MQDNIESINLEEVAQKQRHSRPERRRFIHKNKNNNNNFNNRQNNNRNQRQQQNQNQDRENWRRDDQRGESRLFETDIYHIMAQNTVSDLINEIKSRCGKLVKLNIIVTRIQQQDQEPDLIIKAYFADKSSADECHYFYNGANLDGRVLRTERKY